MRKELKLAFKQAIEKCLPVLQNLCGEFQEPSLVWSKRVDGGWEGFQRPRTNLALLFIAAEKQLNQAASDFAEVFFSQYPDYGEGKLVGCAGLASMQLGYDKAHLLKQAICFIWDKYGTFAPTEDNVDALVNEFHEFIDSSKIRLRFQSSLLNFRMVGSLLRFPKGLTLRRLSDAEVTDLHGGRSSDAIHRPLHFRIHEWVIEGEMDGEKTFGGLPECDRLPYDEAESQLDRAIHCLRTFKEGRVGYDQIRFKFVKFCPLHAVSYGSFNQHIPPGIYEITEEEVSDLREHAEHILGISEPALLTACARLADAEARLRPQDQILDAVIGMEALLLAGLPKDDRKGELKFRFSMNYSTLFMSPDDRMRAFKEAKHLYDHRSTIAHGGEILGTGVRLGEQKLSLQELAGRAKNALRMLIKHFLPQAAVAPYKKSDFWEKSYFELPDPDV